MKYSIYPIFLVSLCTACSSSTKNNLSNFELNGNWTPIKEEFNGNSLPPEAFAKQKLVIQDSLYTVTAESIDKGVIRFTGSEMDIFGKKGVNKDKHFTAIYKLENNELSIAYNLSGDGIYPTNYDTKGKTLYFAVVYKKE